MNSVATGAKGAAAGRRRRSWQTVVLYLLLVLAAVVIIFPIYYALAISLMAPAEASLYPPHFIPHNFTFQNYQAVLRRLPIPRYLLNSLIVSVVVVIGQLITASLAAYAFAMREFKGRTALFILFLSTLMIPFEVTIIPNFQTIQRFGWIDNYLGLFGPFLASAFGTFLLRQFFLTIPKELHDAAEIDGCSSLRFLIQIVVPLARPALGTVGVYGFLQTWNQYLWPLLVTNQPQMRTMQIGLRFLNNEEATSPTLIMTGVVLAVIPTIVLLFLGQRQLIRGLTAGAVKG
jgi:sn-glycerol 3-phosphate transport system permease protein